MTSYRNSIHALRELVGSQVGEGFGCRITKLSKNISRLENGIEYCLVEVTCEKEEQYGIQAFGEEAVELHKEALKHNQQLQKGELTSLVL